MYILLPLLVVACDAELAVLEASPECDQVEDQEMVVNEMRLHGARSTTVPTTRFYHSGPFNEFLEAYRMPDLEVDFSTQNVLVTSAITMLDCEYVWDMDGDPELIRLDDTHLGVRVPLGRDSDDCIASERVLPLIFTVPDDEDGEISEVCVLR